MIIHPRHKWTSTPCRESVGADTINSLPWYGKPKGITFVTDGFRQEFASVDPARKFQDLLDQALSLGHSDIDYNLGVAGNANGIWSLRGLQNKSSASPNPDHNGAYVSVYLSIGTEEKPTDSLLRGILEARQLVLSRYVQAVEIEWPDLHNPWLDQIFTKGQFWKTPLSPPVGNFTDPLPTIELKVGHSGIHVQELQELLAYLGYYRVRVDNIFNAQTEDAVVALQADLKEGGLFHYDLTGIYDSHLRRAWLKFLKL